jgi:membrane associated rhomboid family serine protease
MLLFPPIPMQLRTLAWVMVAIAVATVFFNAGNAGGEAAHLGGAVVGYLLIQRPQVLNVFAFRPKR